jgi:hypothetical protein
MDEVRENWKTGTRNTEVKFGGRYGLYNVVIDGIEYTRCNVHTIRIRDPKRVVVATIKMEGRYSVHAGKDCPSHLNDYTADCTTDYYQGQE